MSISLAPVTQTPLQDDFSNNIQLNPNVWEINQYVAVNNPSYYGRTQIEQSLPVVSNGALELTVQTYNPGPGGPGNSFLGSEIISKQTFNDNAGGIAFTAVAKIVNPVPGMVGGIFAYNYNSSTNLDNEIDFESLTNDAAAQNKQEQTNVYSNQPLGAGNPEFVPDPSLTTYQTYTMEWFPNEVLWFINGQLVRESTDNVPQGPMAFHLNFWAPDTTWADAYSSSLQPTANPQDNTTYTFDVESLSVATIEDINTTLTISGTVANQATIDTSSLSPLSKVVVSDVNPGQTDTVTVALSSAMNGTLSNVGGGRYNSTSGVYTDTGTAATVTAALDGLVFTPTVQAQTVTTTFTIKVTDTAAASAVDGTATVVAIPAPTLTTLVNFNGTSTGFPQGSLIADASGDLFGTTTDIAPYGDDLGPSGYGTVFEVAKTAGGYSRTPILLASFNFTDGASPEGSLIADAAGDLFGATAGGGAYGIGTAGGVNGDGTVFEIAKTGNGYATTPTTLVSFNGTDGASPEGGLIADASGNLFGTTEAGGEYGHGTVFEIAKTGDGYATTPTVLANWNNPAVSEYFYPDLVMNVDGDLFGTTYDTGQVPGYDGSIFEITKTSNGYASSPTVLVSFNGTNGVAPSGLMVDAAGNLLGVNVVGALFEVFEIAKTNTGYASTPTILASFANVPFSPNGPMIADAAGDLFGITSSGGANDWGTIYEIAKTSSGYAQPTILVNFNNQTNGSDPTAGLIAAAGHIFGTTSTGGLPGSSFGNGTVFELSDTGFQPVPPVLSGGGNSVNYAAEGAAVAIDAGLGVSDTSSATLAGATVAIGTGFLAGDTLNFTNQNGIAGSYDAATGVLTLTGSASLDNYQAALDSITFSSTSDNPSNSGADTRRTVSWTVTDGTQSSHTIASTIIVTGILFVSSSSHTQTSTDLKAGGTVTVTLDMSESHLTVTGTPGLTLNDGAVASYVASASKPASGILVFKYTVGAGQNTADLQVTGVTSGAWSVTDAAGHHAVFSGAVQDLRLTVDTNTPKVSGVSSTPTSGGIVGLGQTVKIDLDLSDSPLVVNGTPTLKLSDGGIAKCNSSASKPASGILEFDYTVLIGQNTTDLKITGSSVPSGASIKDLAGNAANLALTAAEANLDLTVEGTPPMVTAVTPSPASGDVLSGSAITITLKLSEPVTVTGSPTLTLSDGGVASYAGGTGTTTLTFTYAVGPESTTDLRVTGIDQSGGNTITDLAGNPLSSTLASDLKLQVNVFTFTQIKSGGAWNSASNWSPADVPGAGDTALITKSGTYTVSATEDNTVAVVQTAAGATLLVGGGTTFAVSGGTGAGANAGKIVVEDDATLDIGGTFVNSGSGTLFASGAGSTVDIAGVVTGGTAEVGNGVVDIEEISKENVTFQSGRTGGLQLDDASAYSGKISGFGSNTSQFIDLTKIDAAGARVSYKANSTNTGGVLTVFRGSQTVASINMVGKYTTASFHLGADGGNHLEITDPPVVAGGVHSANIALLGNYMAASVVTPPGGQGGALIAEAWQTANQPPLLTLPHHA
jgi:uncharacterized repeat protein (TIGR03803 family)